MSSTSILERSSSSSADFILSISIFSKLAISLISLWLGSTRLNRQAVEMATIYGDILSRIMDAFSAIISNNQNGVMQFLTRICLKRV